jgi:hypothetical protein
MGTRDRKGYGYFSINGKTFRAARVVFAVEHSRDLRAGCFACHRCDNPPCCNPKHLFEGTASANMADRRAQARLCANDVRAIRVACAAGEPHPHIAARYNVHRTTVSMIHRRVRWAHVE